MVPPLLALFKHSNIMGGFFTIIHKTKYFVILNIFDIWYNY